MAMRQNTIRSTVAGIGTAPSLKERMDTAKKKGFGLKIASFGAALVPVVGVGFSYLLDRKRNSTVQQSQMDVLAEYYRFQIAATLGINPEKVSASDLQLASQINPALKQAVQKVNDEKKSANRSATVSNGAIWAVSGANLIPLAGFAGKVLTDVTAATVADTATRKVFDQDVLPVSDMVEMIDAKLKSNEAVTAHDIMLLRAAQDEQWQKDFKNRYKTAFHKMKPETQQQIIASMPELIQGAEKQAYALNNGLVSPQNLVMEGAASATDFAGAVDSRPRQGSFASTEVSRRLAAQQQQVALKLI